MVDWNKQQKIEETWKKVYEETEDTLRADDAVFEAIPDLRQFKRYQRPGDPWFETDGETGTVTVIRFRDLLMEKANEQ